MSIRQKSIIIFVLGAAILGSLTYFARIVSRPEGWEHYQKIPWVTYVHPNVKKLSRAKALLRDGKLEDARALLIDALTTAPRSPVTRELRDLLGDVNTQIFFSKEPSPRKTEYTVKQGDALSSIARKLKSSADAIMYVNGLNSTLIRTGETLAVPHLDFTITIDLSRERVVVHDGHGFFTQYPIVSADLPPSRKSVVETKVSAKSFWKDGHPVRASVGVKKEGTPRIHLQNHRYVLYGVDQENNTSDSEISVTEQGSETESPSKDTDRPPQGVAMLKPDIAELDLLIRKGTPVTIILDRQ